MGGASEQTDQGFQQWKSKYAPKDTGSDYDLYGAYKAGIQPDEQRGHFPDTYKKTNHPTFSVESKYSTPEHPGGTWARDARGRDTFTPSEWMASDPKRMESLKLYFAKAEPNATLIIPTIKKPMGGSPTQAMQDYRKYQQQLPAQKVGLGVGGEMLAAPAGKSSATPNAYSREASKPASLTSESEQAIEEGLK